MKNKIVGTLLLCFQLYITVTGRHFFDKNLNAILFFIISAMIPIYLFKISLQGTNNLHKTYANKFSGKLIWGIFGTLSILVAYEELRKNFVLFKEFAKTSDVIPHAQILYERFAHGQFPYNPIQFEYYTLQPIYFPFHWLPVFFSHLWLIDVRWVGWGMLALIAGIYGWSLKTISRQKASLFLAILCPSLVLWAYVLFAKADLSVTFEIVIGAYYLLLAAGLVTKNYWLIGIGIICCLLSRFTLLFWMPFFAFVLFKEAGFKKSVLFWSPVILALLCFFIIPFYLKDPDFITRGMVYYRHATIGDWIGFGDPPVSWTQENGISFAPLLRVILPGDIPQKVQTTQVIQSIVLLLTFALALWTYKKWNKQIPSHLFMLISLDVFLLIYYFFAPLTYRYYLFSFLIVSSVLCGMIVNSSMNRKNILPDQTIRQS